MRNIKLTIAYDGTGYNGWQVQKNGITIQGEIERVIAEVFKSHHRITGAGRTDAGVHARAQTANFRIKSDIPVEKIPTALNSLLPGDIAILSAEEVSKDFHSQFAAVSKKYTYQILNDKNRDPFLERYFYKVPYKLNFSLMRRELSALVGEHDFKSFQAKDKRERDSVRKIFAAELIKKKNQIYFNITGNGFLYNMVRNIAGTLIDIGRGYLPEGSMRDILIKKDRSKAGPTAPPKGLFLIEVNYNKLKK